MTLLSCTRKVKYAFERFPFTVLLIIEINVSIFHTDMFFTPSIIIFSYVLCFFYLHETAKTRYLASIYRKILFLTYDNAGLFLEHTTRRILFLESNTQT